MVSKDILQSVISKYYLGGLIEASKWKIAENILTIPFVSPNKDMIGELKLTEFNLPDNELCIFNTTQFNKLINILADDLEIEVNKNHGIATKIFISDSKYNTEYALADLMMVSKVGKVTEPDNYDCIIELNEEHVLALIKAKQALADTDHLVLRSESDLTEFPQVSFVFGDNSNFANRITYNIKAEITNPINLSFNSNIIKEIFNSNKDIPTGKISISNEGLMKIEFESENTSTKYYLVKKAEQ